MSTIRKALTAAGFATAAAVGTALLDGDITVPELLVAAGTGLLAGAATWRVPNDVTPPAQPPARRP